MRRVALVLVAAAAAAGLAAPADAFDGRRKGFVLGFGAGYASFDASQFTPDENSGLATRLEIGAGIDDRWIVHYAGKQALDLAGDGQENFNAGNSLFVGAGYEFAPHWNVEIDYVNSSDTAATTHTFLVTVGGLAY